jgi:hypothetical protein
MEINALGTTLPHSTLATCLFHVKLVVKHAVMRGSQFAVVFAMK